LSRTAEIFFNSYTLFKKMQIHSIFLVKKLTVDGASGILAYPKEMLNSALNFDVMLNFSVLVNCMLKA
jgi:hypothetical protein